MENFRGKKRNLFIKIFWLVFSIRRSFYSEDEIMEEDGKKKSKLSGSLVEWVEEESYFFKLSKWEKPLLKFYNENPNFILPESEK